MPNVVLTATPLDKNVQYRQVISPSSVSGSFVADDTDNHQAIFDARGKAKVTVAVDNPANQTVTANVYGLHASDGAVGDVGTFLIGTFTVTAAADKGYETIADPAPWMLIDLSYAVTPTDNPLKTCTLYVDAVS